MKKIYYQPKCLVVKLGTCKMMAESLAIIEDTDDNYVITDSNEILTKENRNIWDEEW